MPMDDDAQQTVEISASRYFGGAAKGNTLDVLWECALAERAGTNGPSSVANYLRQMMQSVNAGRSRPLTDVVLRFDDGRAIHAWQGGAGDWRHKIVGEGPQLKTELAPIALLRSDELLERLGEIDEHMERAGAAAERLRRRS
jgi:hypothetical protein